MTPYLEADQRAAVVAEARAWLGTPYHHRALLKGVGVDCAQLPIGVFAGVGLIARFDTGEYPADWHMHKEEERYLGFVLRFASEIAPEDAQAGDLVLFKFGRAFSHGAIIVAPGVIIHASRKDHGVILDDLDRDIDLTDRPRRYFSYWRGPTASRLEDAAGLAPLDAPQAARERDRGDV
jgi:NlpC/P60 family putative phage cell wall peptidase